MLSRFERSCPESAGISSETLKKCLERFNQLPGNDQMHSFMVVRHGKVVFESFWKPFRAELPHTMFSLSKSFTSTAVGLAIHEGYFSLDDKVVDLFADKLPNVVPQRLKAVTVRQLLTMSCGQKECYATRMYLDKVEDWQRGFLEKPLEYEPGSTFVYNSLGTYMLAALVVRKTGQSVLDYLMPRLFEPLGIARPEWDTCPKGIETGGWGLHLHTEDIAKFGELYLRKGKWGDKQLIPEDWVEMATSAQIDNSPGRVLDWAMGYGFQFWRCQPEGVYRGDGAYGQYCIVLPKQDMVIAITSSVGNMQAVLNVLWETLLPAIQDNALAVNQAAADALYEATQDLQIKLPESTGAAFEEAFTGRFKLQDNIRGIQAVQFDFNANGCQLTVEKASGTKDTFRFGVGHWLDNAKNLEALIEGYRSCGIMTWTGERELTLTLCCVESPFMDYWKCKVEDSSKLTIDAHKNFCFFGAPQWPKLTGHKGE